MSVGRGKSDATQAEAPRRLKATKQQRPCAYSCPHTCHHMLTGRIMFAGIIPSVFRHLQATRHATPACVFSCHVLIRSFSHSACLLHYPHANEEAHVSWFKAGEREKKKVKRNQRDAVSPSSKQDFLRATVLIDR